MYKQASFIEFVEEDQNNRNTLDELFARANAYRQSQTYFELLQFISRFSQYSPYNCFLLHLQNPKITFVATPNQWKRKFNRIVKERAHPLIILAPMGPVLLVYDLADTEGDPIPDALRNPFAARGEISKKVWGNTFENTLKDKIAIVNEEMSSLTGGCAIRYETPRRYQGSGGKELETEFAIKLNLDLPQNSRYGTLVHELGHIYSGHLGKRKDDWWPDRHSIDDSVVELEAESISYLVCSRLGIKTRSHEYLALKAKENIKLPPISIDNVLRVTGWITKMGEKRAI